jgi:hypothetical protein
MNALEALDRAVKTAIAVELGERPSDDPELAGLGIASQRSRNVAGFTIVSNAARDAGVNASAAELADKLMRFRADQSLVSQKLAMHDVQPIAVIPATAWKTLCNRAKLFRFTPQNNVVRVSPAIMEEAVAKVLAAEAPSASVAYGCLAKQHVPIMLVCIAAAVARLLDYLPYGGFAIIAAVINGIVWGMRGGEVANGNHLNPRKDREVAMIKELVAQYTADGTLYECLWPNYLEPGKPEQGRDLKIGIVLPTPPGDVVEKLIRAERARLPLRVAAVGEAIRLRDDVASVFIEERARQIEGVRTQTSRDPIVYVTEGSAVAIVAQFGDFPIEHEVMTEVINSFYLA